MNGNGYNMPRQKVMQRFKNDCMEACLATYFAVPIEDVPVLIDDGWIRQVREWVRPKGLGYVVIECNEVVFREMFSDGLVIVGGPSPRHGLMHACMYLDGKLWHDPFDGGTGVQGVTQVDFFYPLRPFVLPGSRAR